MDKLKRLLFERAYQAEQLRGGYPPGTLEAETWNTTYRVLTDLIYQAGLSGEYQRYVSNQRTQGCFGTLATIALVIILLALAIR